MASIIYIQNHFDQRHSHLGVYVDVAGSFELPVGPFPSKSQARDWLDQNRDRLIELYGAQAA